MACLVLRETKDLFATRVYIYLASLFKGLLNDCNSMSAEYLFQKDKHYDIEYDTGDKVIQCGRHNDIFKFWLMWRAKGMSGIEMQMNRLMSLRKYQAKY